MENYDWSKYMLGSDCQSEAGLSPSTIPWLNDERRESSIHSNDHKDIQTWLKGNMNNSERPVFFTFNPCPEKDIPRRKFKKLIRKWFTMLSKKYLDSKDPCIYYRFERSAVGKLHVHGILYNLPWSIVNTQPMLAYLQKIVHKDIGRAKVEHKVCADVVWCDDYNKVIDYVCKGKKII